MIVVAKCFEDRVAQNILSHAACVRQQSTSVRLFPPFAVSKNGGVGVACGCRVNPWVNPTDKFCFQCGQKVPNN